MSKISYPFTQQRDGSFSPFLSIELQHNTNHITAFGLLDTGSAVNVLPYELGVQLGKVWENETTTIRLGGNLANWEAKGIILAANVADFPPVRLAFAWTLNNDIPVILGQVNFFMLFDVCFFRKALTFELEPNE